MTYILQDVIDQIKTSTEIANLVGDAVYPGVIPQRNKTWTRAITVAVISRTPEMHLRGEGGLHRTQIQIDCLTNGTGGEFAVNELAEAVRNRLNGYRGTIGTGAYGTIRMTNDNSGAVAPVDASDTHYRRASMDFEVIHSASVPTFA